MRRSKEGKHPTREQTDKIEQNHPKTTAPHTPWYAAPPVAWRMYMYTPLVNFPEIREFLVFAFPDDCFLYTKLI
jgi:hypothetical protein